MQKINIEILISIIGVKIVKFHVKCSVPSELLLHIWGQNFGDVLVLHTPIIKYIFEIYLGIICIAVGKNGKGNMEG